jgi:hypothetical protein
VVNLVRVLQEHPMLDAEGHWDDLQPKPVVGGGYEAFRRESLLREPQGSILVP